MFRTLLVGLFRHNLHARPQHRCELGLAELRDLGAVVLSMLKRLHGLAFEAVCNLLECPGLFVLERTLDELLGEDVELSRQTPNSKVCSVGCRARLPSVVLSQCLEVEFG